MQTKAAWAIKLLWMIVMLTIIARELYSVSKILGLLYIKMISIPEYT